MAEDNNSGYVNIDEDIEDLSHDASGAFPATSKFRHKHRSSIPKHLLKFTPDHTEPRPARPSPPELIPGLNPGFLNPELNTIVTFDPDAPIPEAPVIIETQQDLQPSPEQIEAHQQHFQSSVSFVQKAFTDLVIRREQENQQLTIEEAVEFTTMFDPENQDIEQQVLQEAKLGRIQQNQNFIGRWGRGVIPKDLTSALASAIALLETEEDSFARQEIKTKIPIARNVALLRNNIYQTIINLGKPEQVNALLARYIMEHNLAIFPDLQPKDSITEKLISGEEYRLLETFNEICKHIGLNEIDAETILRNNLFVKNPNTPSEAKNEFWTSIVGICNKTSDPIKGKRLKVGFKNVREMSERDNTVEGNPTDYYMKDYLMDMFQDYVKELHRFKMYTFQNNEPPRFPTPDENEEFIKKLDQASIIGFLDQGKTTKTTKTYKAGRPTYIVTQVGLQPNYKSYGWNTVREMLKANLEKFNEGKIPDLPLPPEP